MPSESIDTPKVFLWIFFFSKLPAHFVVPLLFLKLLIFFYLGTHKKKILHCHLGTPPKSCVDPPGGPDPQVENHWARGWEALCASASCCLRLVAVLKSTLNHGLLWLIAFFLRADGTTPSPARNKHYLYQCCQVKLFLLKCPTCYQTIISSLLINLQKVALSTCMLECLNLNKQKLNFRIS